LILNADGTFTYTPTDGYNGPDSFTYEIDDGTGNTTQATVNITVTDYPSNTVIGTSAGDEWGASLIGAAASDDDIYSGGVMEGQRENVQGVAGTISEAQVHIVGSGNDRFILDADDTFSTDAKNADGQIRLRGFSIGDVTTDVDADTLVLGDFLRAGDPTFDGTAADAVRFFHFAGNLEFYLDREGGLGASGDAARVLEDGTYGGVAGGSSLFFEIKTHYSFADTTPDGTTLNSEAQIQALMDLGFLDFS
jgi:hypothetical protein